MTSLLFFLLHIASGLTETREFVVGPTYKTDPDLIDHGRPRGHRFRFTMPLLGSHSIFNGSDPALDPRYPPSKTRDVTVLIPLKYRDGDAAPILILQDGGYLPKIDYVDLAQTNLHFNGNSSRTLPAFVSIAIMNGGGSERSLEYDTMSDRYARFVQHEVLPAVIARPDIRRMFPHFRISEDPWHRGALGCSSGGIASLTMAWFRPDLFRRVAAYSPSAVNLQVPNPPGFPKRPSRQLYPKGAWDYHDGVRAIQTEKKKPLRIFINDNEFDLGFYQQTHPGSKGICPSWVKNISECAKLGCWAEWDCNPPGSCCDGNHSFADGGNRTAKALKDTGYDYRHVYALNQRHCGGAMYGNQTKHDLWTQTLLDTLVWMWSDDP